MRAVIQRVKRAKVTTGGQVTGRIEKGLLVLLGVSTDDNEDKIQWMANKIANLRIFPDDNEKMNKSVLDIDGGILVVSNFTLYGSLKKGFRPSYSDAAPPEIAEPIYEKTVQRIRDQFGIDVQTGIFGAMMDVELCNWGPVTISIEK